MSTKRTQIKRLPKKASNDCDVLYQLLDTALICHVGIIDGGQPFVIPVAMVRDGDQLLLHGSKASRLFKKLVEGKKCCATITIVDGLVMARSAFESSMHYRSVMILGRANEITGARKVAAFDRLIAQLMPGREGEVRKSTAKELKATTLVGLPLLEYSIKTSNGAPTDLPQDLDSPLWAGVIPIQHSFGEPAFAPDLAPHIPIPSYIAQWQNGRT